MARNGEAAMTVVLNELLLFSCLAAFVTGIDCGRDLAHLSGSGPLPNWPLPYDPLSIDRVPANTVQRETEHYTTLTQMASASVKIISDTIAGWREAGHPLAAILIT